MTNLPLSFNQITADTTDTAKVLAAIAAVGVEYVGLWRHKYINGSATATGTAARANGLKVSSLCRGGFFTRAEGIAAALDDNRRAVQEALEVETDVLVIVCGPLNGHRPSEALGLIESGIEALLPEALSAGVTLAIEPFHPMFLTERSTIVTLQQAVDLVDRFDTPQLKIALDSYHLWWDPDLDARMRATQGRIATVQVGDWLVPTTSILEGRGIPGDGAIDIPAFLAGCLAAGYVGPVEVEILSQAVRETPIQDLLPMIVNRYQQFVLPALQVPTSSTSQHTLLYINEGTTR